jgi:predicted RNase H-like nuclease (RuvC/YqgF family)
MVSQPSAMRARINRTQREKKEERLRTVSGTIEEIRDFFGTSNPDEIKGFFDEHRKSNSELEEQISSLKKECSGLETQVAQLKVALEEAEWAAAKGIGSNRLVRESRRVLSTKSNDLESLKRRMEADEEFHRQIRVSIMHFTEVLSLVQTGGETPSEPTEVLNWSEGRVDMMRNLLTNEDGDFCGNCNTTVLNELIQRDNEINPNAFDHQLTSRQPKPEPVKKAAKETKGDVISRVYGRQATKLLSQKVYQQQLTTKKVQPQTAT